MSEVPPVPPAETGPQHTGSFPPPSGADEVPFVIPTPMEAAPRRPSVLTTAAIALIALAVLNGSLAALAFWAQGSTGSPIARDAGVQLTTTIAVVALIMGALQFIAAVLILRIVNAGRVLGLILAGIAMVQAIITVVDGRGTAMVAVAVNLYLVYALATTGDVFARARRG